MIHVDKEQRKLVAPLLAGIEDSMVTAYLQGYQGDGYVNKLPEPDFTIIISGEYVFLGGDFSHAEATEGVQDIFEHSSGDELTAIYADHALGWRDLLLAAMPGYSEEVMRYGIVQRDYVFDEQYLEEICEALPEGLEIRQFDSDLYHQALNEAWSCEFCETFASAEEYLSKGFGFGVVESASGVLVSGTSTMTVYDGGTEVQVATRPEHRGKGLALATAARFLLECQHRKIRACWDAANLISKHMALKLGFEYRGEYSTVHMHRPKEKR